MILFCFIFFTTFVGAIPTNLRRALTVNDPSLPASVRSICKGGQNATTILDSKAFGKNGVVVTTGVCAPPVSSSPSSPSDSDLANLAVIQPTCVGALNNCISRFGTMFQGNGWVGKCGAPCASACYPGSGGPDPNHCQFIFNSMYGNNPQLFTVEPNNFVLLSYKSCGTGFQNQIASSPVGCSQKMIYDYQDWAAIGSYLAWSCQAPQGARGGKCLGTTGLYQSNIPDYYVQVYPN